MQAKKVKWEPAVMIKRPDNIISSEYYGLTPFVASYENDEINMFLLMAMEYGRIWRKERDLNKRAVIIANEPAFYVRKTVTRGLLKKLQAREPAKIFKMKRFQGIPAKIRLPPIKGQTVMKNSEVSKDNLARGCSIKAVEGPTK